MRPACSVRMSASIFPVDRRAMATVLALSLTCIYPYLHVNGLLGRYSMWLAMWNLFACPILVCVVAGRHFIGWGALTNAFFFAWCILQVYVLNGYWDALKMNAEMLAVFGAFAVVFGAVTGGFVERQYRINRQS